MYSPPRDLHAAADQRKQRPCVEPTLISGAERPQTDVLDVEPREAGKQLIRVEGKNFSPFGALHGETDGSGLGVRWSAEYEISVLMERDICVGTEAVFNVAEELSAEEAHPDIDAAPELACGSTQRTERSS